MVLLPGWDEVKRLSVNGYWQLRTDNLGRLAANDYLQSKGYTVLGKVSRGARLDAVDRCRRGLLPYSRYDLETLHAFRDARGLSPGLKVASRAIRALEKADDNVTFDRFFELPPEIRDITYKMHVGDFDKVPLKHKQPPLALTSTRLRREFLPVFNVHALFVSEHIYSPCNVPRSIVAPIPNAMLARIRHVEWTIMRSQTYRIDILLDYSPNVKLHQAVRVRFTDQGFRSESTRRMERAMHDIVQAKITEEGNWVPNGTNLKLLFISFLEVNRFKHLFSTWG